MTADAVVTGVKPFSAEGNSSFPVVEAIPAPVDVEPSVRAATYADLDAIVGIETSAFRDVYGVDPDPMAVTEIRQKYIDRIELLGDLVRVLQNPDRGVYGVMVCCTTDLGRDDFLTEERDMTSSATLREIYNLDGKNAYIVNLAVHPKYQGGESLNLLVDALKIGEELGVEKAYFTSRLPGFEEWTKSWAAQEFSRAIAEEFGQPPTTTQLADYYWRLKVEEQRVGGRTEKAFDPLLRFYVDFGAKPLKLVEDAWKPDKSSHGYGVLCEYDLAKGANSPTSPETLEPARTPRGKVFEWIRNRQKLLALGAIVLAAGGYVASQGGLDETLASIKEMPRAISRTYLGSLAAFGAGIVLMGVGAVREIKWSNWRHPITEIREAALRVPDNRLVRTGFWLNWAGALGADAAIFAGIAETSHNLTAALSASTVPAADLAQGVAMRAPAVRRLTTRREPSDSVTDAR